MEREDPLNGDGMRSLGQGCAGLRRLFPVLSKIFNQRFKMWQPVLVVGCRRREETKDKFLRYLSKIETE